MADSKVCTKCGLGKPVSEFRADKQKRDGLYPSCRECCRATERRRYETDPEYRKWRCTYHKRNPEVARNNGVRQRTICRERHTERRKAYYERAKLRPEIQEKWKEYRDAHRQETANRGRRWREANHDRVMENIRRWQAENPEAARMARKAGQHRRRAQTKSGMTSTELRAWFDRVKKVCCWCGKRLTRKTLTIDHYVPLARGGKHEASNLVPSCRSCNSKKNARDPIEWAQMMGKLL